MSASAQLPRWLSGKESVYQCRRCRFDPWVGKIPRRSEVKWLSCVRLFATPWTVPYQAPLSMGFSRQEYWSGFPSPGGEAISFFRGIFPIWRSNTGRLHCRQILYCLSYRELKLNNVHQMEIFFQRVCNILSQKRRASGLQMAFLARRK